MCFHHQWPDSCTWLELFTVNQGVEVKDWHSSGILREDPKRPVKTLGLPILRREVLAAGDDISSAEKHKRTKRTLVLWFHAVHLGPWNFEGIFCNLLFKKINPAEAVLANFTHCWRWMLLHTDWWVATLETETPAFALRHSKRTSSEWGPLHTLIICLPGMSIQPLRPCPPCHWANRSAEALYEFYPGTIGMFTCPSSPSDIIHPHNVWICLRTSSAFS